MKKNEELAKNTLIISIGKLCTQFLSFILLPLYTAVLTTEEYGTVDLISTYVQLLLPVLILQVDQALLRFVIDDRKNKEKIRTKISSVVLFLLVQFVILTIIYVVSTKFITFQFSKYLYFTLIITSVSSVALQIARGIGDNVAYSFASFLCGAGTVICNVIFITVFHLRTEGMLLSVIIGNLLTVVYLFFKLKIREYLSISSFNREMLKEMLVYSIPLVPNALIWWVVNASDRTIVLWSLGAAANGILAISHKFPTLITTLYNIFHISWTESAALHLKENDRDAFFSSVFDTVFRIFSAASIGLIAVMPFVFSLLINKNYADAYYQIPIYTYASLFNVIVGLYSVIYISEMKTSEIAKTSLYSGIINIVINFMLIKRIGLYAASISSVFAFGVMALYRARDIKKYINHKIDYKLMFVTLIMLIVVSLSYYSNNLFAKIVSLFVSIVYSFAINRALLNKIIIKIIRRK
jgi:O-antigen/teichoic acid export membrane protein